MRALQELDGLDVVIGENRGSVISKDGRGEEGRRRREYLCVAWDRLKAVLG